MARRQIGSYLRAWDLGRAAIETIEPRRTMSMTYFMTYLLRLAVAIFAVGVALLAVAEAAPAAAPAGSAQTYPWCVSGSSLHCYYMNREQCEQTVDYHGFCELNPDLPGPDSTLQRRPPLQ